MSVKGAVVAAHPAAAQAGLAALDAGGNAVDAACAAAFALAVVDPANCGLAGHGGCLVVHPGEGAAAVRVDFPPGVPRAFDLGLLAQAGKSNGFAHGGASVTAPAVVPGLAMAHSRFGRLSFADLLAPALGLARTGFEVGPDLALSLAWAAAHHGGISSEFKAVFFREGRPLREGSRLKQPELAESLEEIARKGGEALLRGPLVEALCRCAQGAGGVLAASDFSGIEPVVSAAKETAFAGARIYGPHPRTTGYGVLVHALENLAGSLLGENRGPGYVAQVAQALRQAWVKRRQEALPPAAGHTSHLCAGDEDGMLVSLTFTHGPLWFGSGLLAPETGMVLNCGGSLIVRSQADHGLIPVHNMCPVIVAGPDGARHALGSPGGSRIPAIVLQAIVDVLCYRLSLSDALARPRLAVAPDGSLEVEPELSPVCDETRSARLLGRSDFYGPASGLTALPWGELKPAWDPRFSASAAAGKK